MDNFLQNIVLMIGFIGIGFFLDYFIQRAFNVIEYIIRRGEKESSQLVYFLSISPYLEELPTTEESEQQEDPDGEAVRDGSDKRFEENESEGFYNAVHCNDDRDHPLSPF